VTLPDPPAPPEHPTVPETLASDSVAPVDPALDNTAPVDPALVDAAVGAATKPTGLRKSGSLDSVISVVAFMVGNRFGGLALAISLATVWGVFCALKRVRSGKAIGKLLPLTTGFLVLRGAIGLATDSKALYFGIGIGAKVLVGLALLASVLVRRPALAWLLPYVMPFPAFVRAHLRYARTMAVLTVIAAVYELGSSAWDIWLYNNSSTNGFVLIRFGVAWVSGFVAIFGSIFYADWALRKIDGFDGLLAMMEELAAQMGRPAPSRS
jgi:hypothetical protein